MKYGFFITIHKIDGVKLTATPKKNFSGCAKTLPTLKCAVRLRRFGN